MSDITSWTETAAGNNATPPDGFPEGQAPSTLNDSARELMAAVCREWNRSHPTLTAGGTANALTLTYGEAPAALVQGMRFSFLPALANTAVATLDVNGLGATDIYRQTIDGPAACVGGEIKAGQVVELVYDGTRFQITNGPIDEVGAITPTLRSSAPAGYLLCDGSAISRTTYAALFAAISTAGGAGNGSTTFNVPDMRGRAPIGKDGGTNRVTSAVSGINGNTLGATGGDQRLHTHTHTGSTTSDGAHTHTPSGGGQFLTTQPPLTITSAGGSSVGLQNTTSSDGAHAHTVSINNAGSGGSENMPPSIVVNYLIKA